MNNLSDDDNAPSAVCSVLTSKAVMMTPVKLTCSTDWTLEYTGYLMSQYYTHSTATHECVDAMAEKIQGTMRHP